MKMFEFRFKNSLKFVPDVPIDNKPALVQVMVWCRPGDKTIIWTNFAIVHRRIYASRGIRALTGIE